MTDLIPPDVRSRLRGLRLVTRRAVGSHGLGLHQSHSRGAGLEFAQYRAYEPGDELRQIDWKLYARSDKFFVREAERESPVAVWILIDASASMGQADAPRPHYRRLDAAKGITAAIAELALKQGDRFGFMALCDEGMTLLPPATGARHRDRLLLDLLTVHPARGFAAEAQLGPVWERIGAHDLVILLSDCFDDGAVALAEKLAAAGRETLVIEMLTVAERDFPFDGGYRFRDPETGEQLLGDGAALRAGFIARFGQARAALHARLDGVGIRHAAYVLDEPIDLPLRRLFSAHGAADYA
ncbi:DUF58 domain-containing protein [Sphingobium sp. AR-3-1]|uniref:DUF58 domain-containing protein n=1 Tax=Sphingobium psychrophilum TaxID=2728834 RepID=A0A7X9ZUA9_9SPHN|nr:DUF58 domain-containing protein [Sphingobium psychrophilum]NML11139.1 DUF58 domain-containing protein [Sphingobium psychrophilum]